MAGAWFICVFLVFYISPIRALERNQTCTTPNGENATCVPVDSCKIILQSLLTLDVEAATFARLSQCGYDNTPLVCCGTSATLKNEVEPPKSALLPNKTNCGYQLATPDRIIGGRITHLMEFPWMALLEYKNKDNSSAGFKCGGSLINERYVLTAAHCVKPAKYQEVVLQSVRFGEWNISSEIDCSDDSDIEDCCNRPLDLKVETVVWHSNYTRKKKQHDIALVRLEKNVEFDGFVRPICLPPTDVGQLRAGHELIVSGWGATENETSSDVKLKVTIPFVPLDECQTKLGTLVEIDDGHICAGGRTNKDSCQGDSGGPLMRTFVTRTGIAQFFQVGVVSYGIGCGRAYPAVYTKVSEHVEWIISNMYEF